MIGTELPVSRQVEADRTPPQMAHVAEDVGSRKAAGDAVTTFLLAGLAGAFIALGAVFSTTVMAGEGLPYGVERLLGGLAFSLGLILVVVAGAELFTGNNLMVMAWASRRVTALRLVRNLALVYVGNFAGAVATAGLVAAAQQYKLGGGAVGQEALRIAVAKTGSASGRQSHSERCATPSSASPSGSPLARARRPTGFSQSWRPSRHSSRPGSSTRSRTCTSSPWRCSPRPTPLGSEP